MEELLYDVPGSSGILDCPLLLMQVTRLRCGGFIFALRLNHTMSDAFGLFRFLSTVAELAHGAEIPSILPVWQRHLLSARDPPHVSYTHHEYDIIPDTNAKTLIPLDHMVQRSIFFGPAEISALRHRLSPHLRRCTTFELLAACIWRCRTIALSPHPDDEVRILCFVNGRRLFNPPLPAGYYGNAVATPVAISTAGNLCKQPLDFALELVIKTKSKVTEEYIKSAADLMVMRGRPHFTVVRTYVVSDLAHAGHVDLDYGWGTPVYSGPTKGGVGVVPGLLSFHIPVKNNKGDRGILVPIWLPANAMEVFVKEVEKMVKKDDDIDLSVAAKSPISIHSARL
ncbi:Benzyl alcohol O-benzoyltransferase [Sesamum alatum]|uniref:Benzyl alcohol O-benzoyltransferase n=1 Tax=Sesamum alatum TaxID=300844 RepID=A0AAE1YIK9_9LAMI|nr:Benzyl alcohol O-benzoyltransferase [Sesamum alatum]